MDYNGQKYPIQFGKGGLLTDLPQGHIPATSLIRAENVSLFNGVLEKDFGSRRWNQTVFPSGIKQFKDFWTDSVTQYLITVLKNGSVYASSSAYQNTLVTPTDSTQTSLNANNYTTIVNGGSEVQGNPRKCFIFTGYNPPQVIYGNSPTTRQNLKLPPADWSGTNQPFGGVIHRGRLWAWGNNPSTMYVSSATNHEDFTTLGAFLTFGIYPGEGERIVGAYVFRGSLYVFKYPLGVYQLVDSDPSTSNWYFTKFTDAFGAASPHSFATIFDDLLIGNNYGSITSLKAALIFGDVYLSDMFYQLKMQRYAGQKFKAGGFNDRQMIFYPSKKQILTSFQSTSNYVNDTIVVLDYQGALQPNTTYQIAQLPNGLINTKDQPNCLAMVRDSFQVERPFYGSDDGYLYQMDQIDRWVGDSASPGAVGASQTAYTMVAQTPHLNFSDMGPGLGELNKLYEYLEVEYEPTGDYDLTIDVYIDTKFSQTVTARVMGRSNLGNMRLSAGAEVGGTNPYSVLIPIYGMGRRISFNLSNATLGQNVRIVGLGVYFNVAGTQQSVKAN